MSLLDILYPPRCLHCGEGMESHARLCSDCLSHFTLLQVEGHCEKCFSSISTLAGTCKPCREKRHHMRKLGACFDAYGPAQTLLHAFLRSKQLSLAKEIASLIIVQLEALRFPVFDAITMVPNSFSNPQYVIAKEVARLLEIPFLVTLRKEIRAETRFCLKRNCNLINKRLLLLDTTVNTRLTIFRAAETLALGWPQIQYGMTFCAT